MSEKCINKVIEIDDFNKNCCGCPQVEGVYYPSSNPYISYEVGAEDMLSYSPTQWVIPIKFHCGCEQIIIPGAPIQTEERFANIHHIKTVGANPANVFFVYLTNTTFAGSYPSHFGGQTYSQTLTGWAMVVDKDPANILQAKSSGVGGVTIEVQKCSTSTPFSFQLFTEYFFSDNFRRYSNSTGCSNPGTAGSTAQVYLWQGAQNTAGHTFLNGTVGTGYAGCYTDMTNYFATPVVFSDSCVLTQAGSNIRWQALKTIQSITVTGSNEPLTWGTGAGVWATYDGTKGLWYVNVDKNPGGTFHDKTVANPALDSEVTLEIEVLESNTPCDVDPNVAFNNSIKINTITVTLALSNFSNISFCTF